MPRLTDFRPSRDGLPARLGVASLRIVWPVEQGGGLRHRARLELQLGMIEDGQTLRPVEMVGADAPSGEAIYPRHELSIGDAPARLPVVPGAPHRADAGGGRVERVGLLEAPFAQWVKERLVNHRRLCSQIADLLTIGVRSSRTIFVSAQIIRFRAMADFPNRIRELRVGRNWSQDQLADEVGCAKAQISDLERGNRGLTVDWMRRLADALGVTPADLLSREDNPLLLDDTERELIQRYRSAAADQQQNLKRVAEALLPYRGEEPEPQRQTGSGKEAA
jgi:transcriptional regulator with XRE-family HTH domain